MSFPCPHCLRDASEKEFSVNTFTGRLEFTCVSRVGATPDQEGCFATITAEDVVRFLEVEGANYPSDVPRLAEVAEWMLHAPVVTLRAARRGGSHRKRVRTRIAANGGRAVRTLSRVR